jgi:20S proteasome alpha/beta subunit
MPEEGSDPIPRIYQLPSETDFAPMLNAHGFALAGIAQYALYLLNRLYEPDRSVEELQALAVYVINETASQDGKVGGPVKVVIITPDTRAKLLGDPAVKRIEKTNEGRSKALRDSFYGRSDA